MNNIIPINDNTIDGQVTQTVNARELHDFLGVQTRFNDWITLRIKEYGFKESIDYVCFTEKIVKPRGGRPSKEYYLSLDMAKEILFPNPF